MEFFLSFIFLKKLYLCYQSIFLVMPKNTSIQPITPWEHDSITVTESREIRRLQLKTFSDEIGEALNVNKGLLYTLKGLSIAPGQTIQDYLGMGRYRVMNPLKYLLVLMTIFLLIAIPGGYFRSIEKLQQMGTVDIQGVETASESAQVAQVQKMVMEYLHFYQEIYANYFNFWMILTVGFISVFTYFIYKKKGYNFLEHIVINLFANAHITLLLILAAMLTPFLSFTANSIVSSLTVILGYIYFIWVYKQLFQQGLFKTFLKASVAYLFGSFVFSMLFAMVIFGVYYLTHRETFSALGL